MTLIASSVPMSPLTIVSLMGSTPLTLAGVFSLSSARAKAEGFCLYGVRILLSRASNDSVSSSLAQFLSLSVIIFSSSAKVAESLQ